MSEEEITKMYNKYCSFEIHYPSFEPSEEGDYFGKTPLFEQAYQAARNIGGSLYGITPSGDRVFIDFDSYIADSSLDSEAKDMDQAAESQSKGQSEREVGKDR